MKTPYKTFLILQYHSGWGGRRGLGKKGGGQLYPGQSFASATQRQGRCREYDLRREGSDANRIMQYAAFCAKKGLQKKRCILTNMKTKYNVSQNDRIFFFLSFFFAHYVLLCFEEGFTPPEGVLGI